MKRNKTYEYDYKVVYIDTETHRRLKMMSAEQEVPVGRVIKRLVKSNEG